MLYLHSYILWWFFLLYYKLWLAKISLNLCPPPKLSVGYSESAEMSSAWSCIYHRHDRRRHYRNRRFSGRFSGWTWVAFVFFLHLLWNRTFVDVAQVSYQSDALLLPSRQCRRTEITLQNKSGHTYLGDGVFSVAVIWLSFSEWKFEVVLSACCWL